MACEALISIEKPCDNNTGGIRTVWICQQENIITPLTATNFLISTFTVDDPCNVYAINRNTGNYTEEIAQDLINGSTVVTQTITLMFNRRQATKSEAINVLGSGQQYLAVIVEDANANFWYFENAQLTAAGEGSGTARADGSKYSVTLVAESDHLAYQILSAQITGNDTDFPLPEQS